MGCIGVLLFFLKPLVGTNGQMSHTETAEVAEFLVDSVRGRIGQSLLCVLRELCARFPRVWGLGRYFPATLPFNSITITSNALSPVFSGRCATASCHMAVPAFAL